MTSQEVHNTLVKEFLSNFDATIPISITNTNKFFFTTGVPTTKPSSSPYVRFFIQNNISSQVSFGSTGNRKFGRMGLISYQVFVPENTGTQTADSLCEQINTIFEGNRFETIYCESGFYDRIGIQEDGFFMSKGTIFWNMDEVK